MWRSWRKKLEPWRELPGWEFDLLRTLPPDTARNLYLKAALDASPRIRGDPVYWVLLGVLGLVGVLSLTLIWAAGAALGLGPAGQIVLEVAFHVTVGLAVLHPLARRYEQQLMPHIRAELADVLMSFAENALAPPPPLPLRPRWRAESRSAPD